MWLSVAILGEVDETQMRETPHLKHRLSSSLFCELSTELKHFIFLMAGTLTAYH